MLLERHAAACESCLDLLSGAADLVTPPLASMGAASLPPAEDPLASDEGAAQPLRFGPFRVLAVLGRGGMGVVYRAEDERSGEVVAIKTVQPSQREALLSLQREMQALSQIRHPGVVRILAQGDQGAPRGGAEVAWYAMQLVEGQTLAARLAARRKGSARPDWPPGLEGRAELLEILRQLCATLTELHAAGFVHRDLSPRNVIIRPDRVPVLVDFGFALTNASLTGEREVLRIDTLQAGTLLYTAPEQFLGEPTDARSDLYSVGCILYEVLTGRPPFLGRDPRTLIDAHLSLAPRPPSQLAPAVPLELEQLVLSLLAKHPRQRPAYADQVARALVPAGQSAPEGTPGYLYRPSLVGRQAPMADLQRLADACDRGQGSRVFITGESGAGKTRLAVELASRAHRLGMQVVLGTSSGPTLDGQPETSPTAPALQPIRPFLRAVAETCRSASRAENVRLLGPRGRLLASYEPALLQVPGLDQLPRLPPLVGDGARFRLFDALEHLLGTVAARRPLCLILDDLQWADELTLSFVCEHLGDEFFARHAVLIAATCRDEALPPELLRSLGRTEVKRLSLPPLETSGVARMITEMLGSQEVPDTLTDSVASRACGNPLFVVEYLRTALSEQRLVRSEASWRLSGPPVESPRTPVAVRELVLRRLARLSAPAQMLVELAAVLGRELEADQLLTMAGKSSPAEQNLSALAELVVKQVLEIAQSGQYRFVHDQLREIAYAQTPAPRRRAHHALAASVIEGNRSREIDFGRHYAALAAHCCAARDDRRALTYLQRAANRALRAGTAREAQALCTRAIELGGSGFVRRTRVYRLRAEAHFALADLAACRADALSVLADVCGRAPRTRGQWLRLLLSQVTRRILHRLFPIHRLRRPGRSRLSQVEGAVAAGLSASVSYFTGDWLPMTASLVLGANLAERARYPAEITASFARLGYVSGLTGLGPVASSFFQGATRLAQERNDLPGLALTCYLRAFHDLGQGRFAAAEEIGRRAVDLLARVGDDQDGDIARTIVGHAVFFQGRLAEAGDWYAALFESARRRANQQHMGWALTLRGRSLLGLGRAGEALPLLEEGRRLLAPLADRLSIVMGEGLLATAYLASDRLADAEVVAAGLTDRLRGALLPLAPCIHGYVGAVAVAIAAWERGGVRDRQARRTAHLALRRLTRFSRMFPMARPAVLAMRAAIAAREGQPGRAARLSDKAAARARALGLSVAALEPAWI